MSNQNPFDSNGGNLSGFARSMVSITPDDATDLANVLIGIICKGTAGNVKITTVAGDTVTVPISADEILPVGITRVWSTDTTATTLWGFTA